MYKKCTLKVGDRITPSYNLLKDLSSMEVIKKMKSLEMDYLYITKIIGESEVFMHNKFGFKKTLLFNCDVTKDGYGEVFSFHGLKRYEEDIEKTDCRSYRNCSLVGGCKGEIYPCCEWIPGHLISVHTPLCETGREYYEKEYGIIVDKV